MIYYYLAIFFSLAILTTALYFIFKKFNSKKAIISKIIVLALATITIVRYMQGEVALASTRGLNMFSPFKDNISYTIIGMLLIWFTYATILLVILQPFFKINNIKNLLKFFGVPVLVLDMCLFNVYAVANLGSDAFNSVNFKMILLSLELVISLSYILSSFISKDYFKVNKQEIITLLKSIIPILIAIAPAYTIQVLVGYTNPLLNFKSFSPEHRLMLYLSIIIPVLVYYGLKNKDPEVKRFSLLYFSLAVLWTFMSRYPFSTLKSPLNWPLHLCNTAMFIVPLCIIFKWDKVFYFTFFINVIGAFLAMAIPNTSNDWNVFSTSTILFWINHFCAFFMPVLAVALGIFKRPKLKQWIYSISAFCVYFLFILFINAWFSNYGSVDYFFLNSDFIVDKLGTWAENTRNYVVSFKIRNLTFTFYPLYQFLFFLVYVIISLGLWFIYEQLFQMWDLAEDRRAKERDYKQMKKDLAMLLKGRSEDEPMSGNGETCLELKHFSKKYGVNKFYSVEDASFKVNGGEIFGFLGPNGAGKSTIIKSIVGIQTISDGSIEVCGYDVEKQSVQAKKEIGFVPDHYALYENLTGREYINYIADLYEVSKEDRDRRITRYVTNFNLEAAFDNQMKTYSHGMKQKIAIMAALVHNPRVWILDEPLTGLDPNSIYQVKEAMREHAKKGNIVFFSSHIIDVVEKICDRIAIIKKGKILTDVRMSDLEKQNIDLEEFYLETINADLINEYKNYEEKTPVKETKETNKLQTKKVVNKKALTKKTTPKVNKKKVVSEEEE